MEAPHTETMYVFDDDAERRARTGSLVCEVEPTDAATRERIRTAQEREISREEFEAMVSVPLTEEERTQVRELLDWFMCRYPTPTDRLAYARRAYKRWTATGE